MSKHTHISRFLILGLAAAILLMGTEKGMSLRAQTACIGKPYGFPGCPIKSNDMGEGETEPENCGDGIQDSTEECDLGRFVIPTCGSICSAPTCDSVGNCSGALRMTRFSELP